MQDFNGRDQLLFQGLPPPAALPLQAAPQLRSLTLRLSKMTLGEAAAALSSLPCLLHLDISAPPAGEGALRLLPASLTSLRLGGFAGRALTTPGNCFISWL